MTASVARIGVPRCGDQVLVGYDCVAHLADGAVETAIREPLAGAGGKRAIEQFVDWRAPYVAAGVPTSFRCVWVPRAEAVRRGFVDGAESGGIPLPSEVTPRAFIGGGRARP